jgi:predicted RNA binding protein YcfA (HicA-like mRNA interferase family)
MGIAITAARLISLLIKQGFYVVRQSGSHVQLRHIAQTSIRITIPRGARDLPVKTLKSILVQARIPWAEFLKLIGR